MGNTELSATVTRIGDGEQQQIVYNAKLIHAMTGVEENVTVSVTGFNDLGAAVKALTDAANHTMKYMAGQIPVREAPQLTDEEIRKMLNLDS